MAEDTLPMYRYSSSGLFHIVRMDKETAPGWRRSLCGGVEFGERHIEQQAPSEVAAQGKNCLLCWKLEFRL